MALSALKRLATSPSPSKKAKHSPPVNFSAGEYIRLEESAKGFALIFYSLLLQNLEDNPERIDLLKKCRGRVSIRLRDSARSATQATRGGGDALTLIFDGRSILVVPGVRGVPDIFMEGTSELILRTSRIEWTLRDKVPDLRGRETKACVEAMRDGSLCGHGVLRNLPLAYALLRLSSVQKGL